MVLFIIGFEGLLSSLSNIYTNKESQLARIFVGILNVFLFCKIRYQNHQLLF